MKDNWNELQNIKAPDELKAKTLAAARDARRAAHTAPHHAASTRFGIAKRLLAAACAFGVVVGGTALWRGQSASDAIGSAVAHSFGIVAYAADTGETMEPRNSRIVFDDGAGSDDPERGFFSGCLFRVTGENIQAVSATIDKGGLYRAQTFDDLDIEAYWRAVETVEAAKEAALAQPGGEWTSADSAALYAELEFDPRFADADLVMPYGVGKDTEEEVWFADVCRRLENGFTEPYDPEVSYGFWDVSQPYDPNEDLSEGWHNRIDAFEGATLTVTVTFTDDTTQTQTMTLHTGKLAVEYPDDPNDLSGPRYTGEVLTDEQAAEQGYLYGVYAELT